MWNVVFTEVGGSGSSFNGTNVTGTSSSAPYGNVGRQVLAVTPVCIRQVRDCSGEDFIMFGMKPQILSLVVILRNIDVSTNKVTYTIEDHTGTIPAVIWLSMDDDGSINFPLVKEGHYCRVYGTLRTMNGIKTILIANISPIEYMNDITTHLLEVIHVRYATEKIMMESMLSATIVNNPTAEATSSTSFLHENSTNTINNNFTDIQHTIYNILQQHGNTNGLSEDFIKLHFSSNQQKDVNAALQFLTSEAHIYTTVDEDHYRCTYL